ncbi:MAG: RNA chaperone Hfq [Firmicutes bacterium]|nr:RNA chaperone Hfq [Bacillota bacterium]
MSTAFQEIVLNTVRRDKIPVRIALLQGKEIKGTVRGFDNQTIVVDISAKEQVMVYKHAIVSILPTEPTLTDARQQAARV